MKAVKQIQDAKAEAKKRKRRSFSLLLSVRKGADPDHRYTTKRQQSRKSKALRRRSKHKVDYLKEY